MLAGCWGRGLTVQLIPVLNTRHISADALKRPYPFIYRYIITLSGPFGDNTAAQLSKAYRILPDNGASRLVLYLAARHDPIRRNTDIRPLSTALRLVYQLTGRRRYLI
jgi:hypothetical protein